MKKLLNIFIVCTVILCIFPLTAFGDMGSKPRVEIAVINPPAEEYYLDLLYRNDNPEHLYSNIEEDENYNREMIAILEEYKKDGWIPAYTCGSGAPMWGSLRADENGRHIFSYFGVPDSFRIITVTESGQVKISDTVTRKAMEANIVLDYENMSCSQKPLWQVYTGQFALTCSVTVITELIILMLFRFKLKENLLTVAVLNFVTQIIFTVLFASAFIYGGTLSSLTLFIPLEAGITVTEAVICRKYLKGQSKSVRTAYALTANIATAMLTWVNIDALMDFMFTLLR